MEHNCSSCGRLRDRAGRYCRECHNAYMREWRKANPSSIEEKAKSNCRAKTHYLIKVGRLIKGACEVCASPPSTVQAHHPDYSQPGLVIWLCPAHHRDLHRGRISM